VSHYFKNYTKFSRLDHLVLGYKAERKDARISV